MPEQEKDDNEKLEAVVLSTPTREFCFPADVIRQMQSLKGEPQQWISGEADA